jgi:hypothetical protein
MIYILSNPMQQSAHFKQSAHKLIGSFIDKILLHRTHFLSFIE